jgi:glycosyltransferase involved in cell wall biosynthesis
MTPGRQLVSVVIPARNEAPHIAGVVASVLAEREDGIDLEVVLVDDGSTDDTAERATAAGARVVPVVDPARAGKPGASRNFGAELTSGDPLIFLDADCTVAPGWLRAILDAHEAGAAVVGGALELPPGLPATARCDYYCGWYVIHPRRPAGWVPHHPPPNLSVRRGSFLATRGFSEDPPLAYANEERAWLADVQRAGGRIYFEPRAVVYHANRPGIANLLRRNYRWGYTAIQSKSQTRAARMAWLYKSPSLLIAASFPLAFAHTAYIVGCWLRVGVFEPVLMLPLVLVSRFAYAAGMTVGGVRWLRSRLGSTPRDAWRPEW